MSGVHTSFRADAHSYTRSKTPWILGDNASSYDRLVHYLSGGGLKDFGRTVDQEEAHLKHVGFLIKAGLLGIAWLVFYFV